MTLDRTHFSSHTADVRGWRDGPGLGALTVPGEDPPIWFPAPTSDGSHCLNQFQGIRHLPVGLRGQLHV